MFTNSKCIAALLPIYQYEVDCYLILHQIVHSQSFAHIQLQYQPSLLYLHKVI